MSRLDRFIRRMTAQKFFLELACAEIRSVCRPQDGIVAEFGLGNGRTYHHLCEQLPDFRIVVFDRGAETHPENVPDAANLIIGEIERTAKEFARTNGPRVVLLHTDLRTPDPVFNEHLRSWLPDVIVPLMTPNGLIVTSSLLDHPDLLRVVPKTEPPQYQYYLFRRRELRR